MTDIGNTTPLTEEWLSSVGFKWHQLPRQPEKHWLLWLGDAVGQGNMFRSFEDLGIVLAPNSEGRWFCWLRADLGGMYSRFLHIRYLYFQEELITLIEALTGQAWDVENNLYGSMRTPAQAAAIRKDNERLDRKIMTERQWREIEKDETRGRALPEHLDAYEKAELSKRNDL